MANSNLLSPLMYPPCWRPDGRNVVQNSVSTDNSDRRGTCSKSSLLSRPENLSDVRLDADILRYFADLMSSRHFSFTDSPPMFSLCIGECSIEIRSIGKCATINSITSAETGTYFRRTSLRFKPTQLWSIPCSFSNLGKVY
ncbi:hypothetical protein RND81_06G182600 [Saponaria officinalis]|uniref:Uncharacterized protein n=1 Tax=Saponaria officinalis TaxID=3572 RepID=A0AAW1KCR1_SAPOF